MDYLLQYILLYITYSRKCQLVFARFCNLMLTKSLGLKLVLSFVSYTINLSWNCAIFINILGTVYWSVYWLFHWNVAFISIL